MKARTVNFILLVALVFAGVACETSTTPTPRPVPSYWGEALPNQPAFPYFPEPGQHWVIDLGCNFRTDEVSWADTKLEKLRTDGIAEVAVLCVPGVKDLGAGNNGLIWLRNWTRHVRLGSAKDDRSVAFLIRPDIDPTKGDRVIEQPSYHLIQVTVLDLGPIVRNAAVWANQNEFDGALLEIVRNVDVALRTKVK